MLLRQLLDPCRDRKDRYLAQPDAATQRRQANNEERPDVSHSEGSGNITQVLNEDGDSFHLKWNRFHENMTSMCDHLRQSDLVDVTLCCESQKVKAHRLTMSACSDYLRDLLKDNPCEHPVIFLTDTTASDLNAIIEFMYKGVVDVPHSQLESFIKTAGMLQIRGINGKEDKDAPAPVMSGLSSSVPAISEPSTSEHRSQHNELHRSTSPQPPKRRRFSVQESLPVLQTASLSSPPQLMTPPPLHEPDSVIDSDEEDAEDFESPAIDPLLCSESEKQLLVSEKQVEKLADLVKAEDGEIGAKMIYVNVDGRLRHDTEFDCGYSDNELSAGSFADSAVDSLPPVEVKLEPIHQTTDEELFNDEIEDASDPLGSATYRCKQCDFLGVSRAQLDQHVRHLHKSIRREGRYKCEWCDYSTHLIFNFKRHCLVHTSERPHPCKFCDKTFKSSEDLVKHERIHTGVGREGRYKCDWCDFSTPLIYNFKRHCLVHTSERPHRCKFCDKTFKSSGYLVKHERIHTGERPYTCNVCCEAFAVSRDLKVHMRIHTGERPYTCNVCGKGFKASGDLTRHMRLRHSVEKTRPVTHQCNLCSQVFMVSGQLTTHLAFAHLTDVVISMGAATGGDEGGHVTLGGQD